MSIYRLLLRSLRRPSSSSQTATPTLTTLIHHPQNPNQTDPLTPFFLTRRSFAFSSAEEAAAERRRRKRRLRIEPPLNALRSGPYHPPPRDPNLPDSTSVLTGPRLNLHNRVQSLIRAGDLDAASAIARHSVFSNTRPTVFTCNAIVAAMYRAKRYNDAVALFQFFFKQSNIVPNIVSYNNLINTHCDEGRVDVGLEVYRYIMANAPFSPSPVTYRHLTKGLIDAGRIGEAVDLLREMLNKGHGADSLVYNNLILGFLNLENLEKANELFDELKERCLVYDGVVNATFMDWFFNKGREKEAMDSYKSWVDREFRMIPATCNVLLEVLLKHGKSKEAWDLFDRMLDNHTPPNSQAVNSETFNIMVNECFKLGKIDEAFATFKKVGTKANSKPFSMDVAGYNNIIARYCEHEMLLEAEQFFSELCSKSLSPDVTTYRTLIDAYLKVGGIDDALKIFKRMVEAGLRVVACFGNRVFEELIKNGKAVDCVQILKDMGLKDPKPDVSCYEVVIMGLCNEGSFDPSRDLVEEMMRYGIGITPALQQFVKEAFDKVGRGEEIERVLSMKQWSYAPQSRMAPRPGQQPGPSHTYPRQMSPPQNPPFRTHERPGIYHSSSDHPQMVGPYQQTSQPMNAPSVSAQMTRPQQPPRPAQMSGPQQPPSRPGQMSGPYYPPSQSPQMAGLHYGSPRPPQMAGPQYHPPSVSPQMAGPQHPPSGPPQRVEPHYPPSVSPQMGEHWHRPPTTPQMGEHWHRPPTSPQMGEHWHRPPTTPQMGEHWHHPPGTPQMERPYHPPTQSPQISGMHRFPSGPQETGAMQWSQTRTPVMVGPNNLPSDSPQMSGQQQLESEFDQLQAAEKVASA
ncbi:hypothetical protein UlMin_037376 [Ulmus minor]